MFHLISPEVTKVPKKMYILTKVHLAPKLYPYALVLPTLNINSNQWPHSTCLLENRVKNLLKVLFSIKFIIFYIICTTGTKTSYFWCQTDVHL